MKYWFCLSLLACFPLVSSAANPPVERVLVVGDSITKHAPARGLGWEGDWGMAASSEEKDYVHLFLSRLAADQDGAEPELFIAGGGGGALADKLTELDRFRSYGADLAIVQMGENDKEVNEEGFQRPYEEILQAIKEGNPKVRILCTGVWAPPNGSPAKDEMIQKACKKFGAVFVDLGEANADASNLVRSEKRFSHDGVNWHPGDQGMEAYAKALWTGWTNPGAASRKISSSPVTTAVVLEEKWDGHSG